MNKHIEFRLNHALQIETLSPCIRGKVGAVIFNPKSYTIISDGYNGPPRKGGDLCGGKECTRDNLKVVSGTRCEIGCHHAESNAIANAARSGVSTLGMAIVITCEPCLMCAKLIHHAGLDKVFYYSKGYSADGLTYLRNIKLNVECVGGVKK